MDRLTFDQLRALLESVFRFRNDEGWLSILVDLPDARVPDDRAWADRRSIAGDWFEQLHANLDRLPFPVVAFCCFPNVGSNNNDLPAAATVATGPAEYARLPDGRDLPFDTILSSSSVVLAPTEMSATAPLKLLAKKHGFRGATLPGFSREMIPVLALDYEKVNARVLEFSSRMDRADGISVDLEAAGTPYACYFDLRFRTGHASGGLMREPGTVGNLPSGEAYIVPYEGERESEPSRTAGELPVQFGDEIVVYRLDRNNAIDVLGEGPAAAEQRRSLLDEPALGNIAEVGIGVLGEWGVTAIGSTLLDEKLGLHIAFGRSDHFGGITGPSAFRSRDRVAHIDRVYVPSTQPLVRVRDVSFAYPGGARETIIRDGAYLV